MTKNQESKNRHIDMRSGNYNESIGRDYIQYIYSNARSGHWGKVVAALLPFLILGLFSGSIGFGGGVVLENHRISPKLQAAQEKTKKAESEVINLKNNLSLNQNSSLQELNNLKVRLSTTQNKLRTTQDKLITTENELNETKVNLINAQTQLKQAQDTVPKTIESSTLKSKVVHDYKSEKININGIDWFPIQEDILFAVEKIKVSKEDPNFLEVHFTVNNKGEKSFSYFSPHITVYNDMGNICELYPTFDKTWSGEILNSKITRGYVVYKCINNTEAKNIEVKVKSINLGLGNFEDVTFTNFIKSVKIPKK